MTIKPLSNQKTTKHEKKDIQDVQNQQLSGSTVRTTHRTLLNPISSSPKSPSPQREQKPQSRSVYDVVGVSSRRRRSPHRRNKRDAVREQREKVACKSPSYQVDGSVNTPCSTSPHHSQVSSAGKSPKSTTAGHGQVANTTGLLPSQNNLGSLLEEKYSGYNSGDEHLEPKDAELTPVEWETRDKAFLKAMSDRGFALNEIAEDGACLFRSISLQIYGDQDMHEMIRQQTMDYIFQNREYFAQFVTEDIASYVSRKRNNHVHGNHIEIQAISEIYNRPVELYCYQTKPINIFNSDQLKNGYEPLRLSYQRGSHYNAILNPYNASVGVGLGLAGYRPEEPELKAVSEAVRLSEELEIEQTMFEDKLKTTDWEATNEAIEEQIARESYLQWCRENMQKEQQKPVNTSSSTVTSSDISGGNKSPSVSGESSFESEDFTTPYPSDEERLDFGAASSSGSAMNDASSSSNTNPLCCVQQRQRRRKRRRHTTTPTTLAGPSSFSTPTTVSTDFNHSSPKLAKTSHRSRLSTTTNDTQPPKPDEQPGTSKQNESTDRPMSEFYRSLLQSSYGNETFGLTQLSENEMVRKALQMSRLDYVQKQQQLQNRTDSDPPSP